MAGLKFKVGEMEPTSAVPAAPVSFWRERSGVLRVMAYTRADGRWEIALRLDGPYDGGSDVLKERLAAYFAEAVAKALGQPVESGVDR